MRQKGEEVKKITEWKFQAGELELIPKDHRNESGESKPTSSNDKNPVISQQVDVVGNKVPLVCLIIYFISIITR